MEPRCACLSEVKTSHSHIMWIEVSCSVPHFLQVGLLLNPITYRCFLWLLCTVRRPITTLDCALLKDNNWAFNRNRTRNKFSSLSLCTTITTTHYLMLFFHPAFNLIFDVLPGDPQARLRSNKLLNRTALCEHVGDFISSYPSRSRDPIQPHSVPGRDIVHRLLALLYQCRLQ